MKETIDKEEIIEQICQHYYPLPESCKEELEICSQVLQFSKTATLVREGEYADKTYFVVEGVARAYYLKDGKDITDWFAFERDFISSINSFFKGIASPHYIEVLGPAVLLQISREHVFILSDKYPAFDRLGKLIVTKTMLDLQQRIVAIQFETAQQKLENLLKVRPDIMQRVALTHIASYLGITLETLSRIRHPKREK